MKGHRDTTYQSLKRKIRRREKNDPQHHELPRLYEQLRGAASMLGITPRIPPSFSPSPQASLTKTSHRETTTGIVMAQRQSTSKTQKQHQYQENSVISRQTTADGVVHEEERIMKVGVESSTKVKTTSEIVVKQFTASKAAESVTIIRSAITSNMGEPVRRKNAASQLRRG
jgi:hypothetical protein